MFTGIIEQTGIIQSVEAYGSNRVFWVISPLSSELKKDQSLSHNGVCLTVEEVHGGTHRVTAIEETLLKTNLGQWKPGTLVNLERCMLMNGRLDGHIVQGHADCVATCVNIEEKNGSREYTFEIPDGFAALIIEKGSIALNGISLTIFRVTPNRFTVAIIPYTITHTNMQQVNVHDTVNIEFDVIGKYVNRINELKQGNR